MRLRGKVVLVTGASKGIGRALSLGLAAEGAHIVVSYRADASGAAEVVRAIAELGGPRAIAVGADVARVSEIEALFTAVDAEHGRLDVLINNAAVTGWADVFSMTEEIWDDVLTTNLKGPFFCALEAAKRMRESGGGSIVNVSSNTAALGVKNLVAYATSKGGLHALTVQLAIELAPHGIRVNTFAPGPTMVERNLRDDPNYAQTWGDVVPMARVAGAEEMVGPALFLASEESSYVTGQVFYADGGWSVQGVIPEAHLDRAAAAARADERRLACES